MINNDLKLWYSNPANEWIEALPIGNGRLGAMVFGDVTKERIALNEDTLWTGTPVKEEKYSKERLESLKRARKLIFEGEYLKAQEIIDENLLGNWTQSYAPMGNLYLDFNYERKNYTEYKRELDLDEACVKVNYKINNIEYLRTAFVSKIDNALVINIKASENGRINFKLHLDSLLRFNTKAVNNDLIELRGKAPIKSIPSYVPCEDPIGYDEDNKKGMEFKVLVKADSKSGNITSSNGEIIVDSYGEVTLKLVAATSFNGYQNESGTNGRDIDELCRNELNSISNKTFGEMFYSHVDEYQKLFKSVELCITDVDKSNISTDVRLKNVINGDKDLSLVSLYFQYGRYLLISSSRGEVQPANLQGIWNEDLVPAWSSNFTNNINVEMNYWPAEVCNLSECHMPLLKYIKELSENGTKTAKYRYGCRGWTAHHNSDLWRQSAPASGRTEWSYWPMAGVWLCSHIWEHYDFTRNKEFLGEYYPVMKGAAEFLLDYLIEDKEGNLVTCPSTSPENNFISPKEHEKCAPSMASTMDMSIARNLFINCIKTIDILNIDLEFKDKLQKALSKLYPYKISKNGYLQEWFNDFEEYEPDHRHLSHLFGLYPGHEITESKCKEIYDAARVSLERRLQFGGGSTGWSAAWVINLFARLKDGDSAYKYLKVLLTKYTFSNLFNICPPFQIDGNFGGTAAVAEMLIQSHEGYIELLPAVPKEWKSGYVKGVRARGNFEVDIYWSNSNIEHATVKANTTGICKIKTSENLIITNKTNNIECKSNNGIIEFYTEKGNQYEINFDYM